MARDLWQALCGWAAREPDRDALVRGERRTSFGALQRRALDVAAWHTASGGRRGDRVLLWMPACEELAAAIFGLWARAAIPVLLDPQSRAPQLRDAIECVGPRALLCSGEAPLPLPVSELAPLRVEAIDRIPRDGSPSADAETTAALDARDPASIVFTSGSTARAKAVTQSHGNLARGAAAVARWLGLDAHDRILCPIPWSHDYGFMQLQLGVLSGVTQILPGRPGPDGICTALESERATLLCGVPSLFDYLLLGVSPLRDTERGTVRRLTNTGGALSAASLEALRELFPQAQIFLGYGLTESYRSSGLDPALVREHGGSIGRAIPGVEIAVVRADGSPAAAGEIGEILHRGDYAFLGYWNDPVATALALRPDPLGGETPGRRALHTGDLGRIDAEGLLYFEGRRDRQLKSMGVSVSPEAVEALLAASGLVREVVVFGSPHALAGHEVWAAAVPHPEVADARRALIRYARDAMPPPMIPRRWLLCDALPRTAAGKPDLLALAARASLADRTDHAT